MLYYVLDQIKLKPGMTPAFLKRFREAYVGPAQEKGLKLVGSWTDPAFELEGRPTEVFVLWSMEDSNTHYAYRRLAGADPSIRGWWQECEQYQVSRVRRIMTATEFSPMR